MLSRRSDTGRRQPRKPDAVGEPILGVRRTPITQFIGQGGGLCPILYPDSTGRISDNES